MANSMCFAIVVVAVVVQAACAETPLDRGAYLVNTLAACTKCHTPTTKAGPGPLLSGGSRFGSPDAPVYAPNLTPDRATGIGTWTDAQIVAALKLGVRPDGSRIGPPMPQAAYRMMSDADASAIAVYLRSVPAVSHAVPASRHKAASPAELPPQPALWSSHPDDPVAQGRYLATALSHCTECHTPVPLSAPDAVARLDGGGRVFRTPAGPIVAPGIRAKDLARFKDDDLATIIKKGTRPDGSRLQGPMPVAAYAGYRRADLEALLAFLRSDQSMSE